MSPAVEQQLRDAVKVGMKSAVDSEQKMQRVAAELCQGIHARPVIDQLFHEEDSSARLDGVMQGRQTWNLKR